MADGNRFYHPKPSFFEEFSKGVGLGLSMRQASDRAKQIEINAQEQRMRMGELERQRGVEDTMRTYANSVLPGTENIPGEMDSDATMEAQGNQQVTQDPSLMAQAGNNDISGVQGVYGPPTGGQTPTLRQLMEFGVKNGASPQQVKSIGDAISMTQKAGPGQFGTDPDYGPYYMDPSGKISSPPAARVQQDRPMNIGPGGVAFDPKTKEVLYQNPAARGRPPADIVNRTYAQVLEDTGDTKAAEEAAAAVRKRLSEASATGSETAKQEVRNSPLAAAATTNLETARTAAKPFDAPTRAKLDLLESADRQAQIVLDNYDPIFLGPIKGTETAYTVRQHIGNYMKSPIGVKEANFRGALARLQEEFARGKEGAVIPVAMYNRLVRLIGSPATEPQVFENAMKRFVTELQESKKTTERLDTAPRGKAGDASSSPAKSMSRDDYMKEVLRQ